MGKNVIMQIAGCTHDASHRARATRPLYMQRLCDVGIRHLMREGDFAVGRARRGPRTYADGRECSDPSTNAADQGVRVEWHLLKRKYLMR